MPQKSRNEATSAHPNSKKPAFVAVYTTSRTTVSVRNDTVTAASPAASETALAPPQSPLEQRGRRDAPHKAEERAGDDGDLEVPSARPRPVRAN